MHLNNYQISQTTIDSTCDVQEIELSEILQQCTVVLCITALYVFLNYKQIGKDSAENKIAAEILFIRLEHVNNFSSTLTLVHCFFQNEFPIGKYLH